MVSETYLSLIKIKYQLERSMEDLKKQESRIESALASLHDLLGNSNYNDTSANLAEIRELKKKGAI